MTVPARGTSGTRPTWPRAVVFDLDGTLVDSAPDIATALNRVLARNGAGSHDVDDVRKMIGGGVPKLIERAHRAHDRPVTENELVDLTSEFIAIYSGIATEQTVLYPGARDATSYLSERGVALAVCTNKPTEISIQILRDLGILDAFGSVVGGESNRAKKPDPAALFAVYDTLGVAPREALMVGDSAADVGSARAAGTPVIVVSYGYTPVPARDLGADGVIDHLDALPNAMSELGLGF